MKYRMDDGLIVDTTRAQQVWKERTDWNGKNFVSRATKDQWCHETLYRSKRGRYYLECSSGQQGNQPSAMWIDDAEAAAWLVLMDHEIPTDLQSLEDSIVE